jgi:hypothetical protein
MVRIASGALLYSYRRWPRTEDRSRSVSLSDAPAPSSATNPHQSVARSRFQWPIPSGEPAIGTTAFQGATRIHPLADKSKRVVDYRPITVHNMVVANQF